MKNRNKIRIIFNAVHTAQCTRTPTVFHLRHLYTCRSVKSSKLNLWNKDMKLLTADNLAIGNLFFFYFMYIKVHVGNHEER